MKVNKEEFEDLEWLYSKLEVPQKLSIGKRVKLWFRLEQTHADICGSVWTVVKYKKMGDIFYIRSMYQVDIKKTSKYKKVQL